MNQQLRQTEQLMLNFGESPCFQPITTVDPLAIVSSVERLYNRLYDLCATLGIDLQTHAAFGVRSRDLHINPAHTLERLTRLQYDLFRLVHNLGLSRYTPAAFTEFYNSASTLLHPDGRLHHGPDGQPIRPLTYRSADYSSILALYNPRPLFADHTNPAVPADDVPTDCPF